MYQVIEKQKDMSDRWVVRVLISPDESAFFNFSFDEPTDEHIQGVAQAFVDTKAQSHVVSTGVVGPSPERQARIEALREQYRAATRQLCVMAGAPVVSKLETWDYLPVRFAAGQADALTAGILSETITYCLNTLRLDDGRDAWDRI